MIKWQLKSKGAEMWTQIFLMPKTIVFKSYHVSLGNIETVYNWYLIKVYRIKKRKKKGKWKEGRMEGGREGVKN